MKVLEADKVIYDFTSDMKEIIRVKQGEVFKVKTMDCFSNKVSEDNNSLGSLGAHDLNPATGPIYIEGAEKGDILKVKVHDIVVNEEGITGTMSDSGIFDDIEVDSVIRKLKIIDGKMNFQGVSLEIDPMIGVIGLAPSLEDGNWPTETPYKHGGNMDNKMIRRGSTVYLPVNIEGGLLALGDLHALMADGEISLGVEIGGVVTLECEVIKNKKIQWPLVEDYLGTMVVASAENLNKASYLAAKEGVRLLQSCFNLSFEDAYALGSLVLNLQICQAVNDHHTVRAFVSKKICTTEELLKNI